LRLSSTLGMPFTTRGRDLVFAIGISSS